MTWVIQWDPECHEALGDPNSHFSLPAYDALAEGKANSINAVSLPSKLTLPEKGIATPQFCEMTLNRDLYIAFIDLTKVFDTVNRELPWTVLSKFGVPPKFLKILKSFHEDMQACVLAGATKSKPCSIEVGVKQGCVLASVIFNLYLTAEALISLNSMSDDDGVKMQFHLDGNLFNLRRLQTITKTSTSHLLELQYAVDCSLVAHSLEALQHIFSIVFPIHQTIGREINIQNTEITDQHRGADPPPAFVVNGEPVKQVEHFTNLGSALTP
ncbi:uncharacterized protein LOC121880327 [Homarus americanus]|uniref:uncharacterized protein LOC121880327 n=1 Tax=Homarus americanus TaxID=6706 RepID=UPI001C44629E|nr:uncharacterized protein LOC121880327 [Homarus americanus]